MNAYPSHYGFLELPPIITPNIFVLHLSEVITSSAAARIIFIAPYPVYTLLPLTQLAGYPVDFCAGHMIDIQGVDGSSPFVLPKKQRG